MRVEQIMKRDVITVGLDARVATIQKLFERHRFHHILIVDEDGLAGIVSDRDILKQLSPFLSTASEQPRDRSTLDKRMHQVMTREPVTADRDMSIEEAADMFVKNSISCLPVLSPDGDIIGIITWRDILRNIDYRSDAALGATSRSDK